MGRRIRKVVTGTAASDTKYLWSGWTLVAELGSNGTTVQRTFLWGQDFSGAGGAAGGAGALLGQIDANGTTTFAMPDVRGNIVGYINEANGALVAAREFSPYGRPLKTWFASGFDAADFSFGYSGQYTDAETTLVYFGYRYYSSKHGRFLNRDPIEEAGGVNLYNYVGNMPTNRWDVLGLSGVPQSPSHAESWRQSWLNMTMQTMMNLRPEPLDPYVARSIRVVDPVSAGGRFDLPVNSPRLRAQDGELTVGSVGGRVVSYVVGSESGDELYRATLDSQSGAWFSSIGGLYFVAANSDVRAIAEGEIAAGRAPLLAANGAVPTGSQGVLKTLPLSEANKIWRSKVGGVVRVDVNDTGITPLKHWFKGTGDKFAVTVPAQHNWRVYGNVDLVLGTDGLVRIRSELYDFDIKPADGTLGRWVRNQLTEVGAWWAGDGAPFTTEFVGTLTPRDNVPYHNPDFPP